jgi:hypothetical protein
MNGNAQTMPDRAREVAYQAVQTGRRNTAAMLENAAARLGERVERGSMRGAAAGRAASGMQEAATYLRAHEASEIWGDVEGYVRQHPMRSLLMAIATGAILARIFR